jgi:hypothetical protein
MEGYNYTKKYELPTGDGEKRVYCNTIDRANNIGESVFDSIILDTTPPTELSIIINDNDEYTNSLQASLDLSAFDSLSGVSDMSFSFDNINWTTWEPFASSKFIILPEGDGMKFIYFRVCDKAGNIAEMNNYIILDMTPPSNLSLIINNNSIYTNSLYVELNLAAMDALSGIFEMSFSFDSYNWSEWEPFKSERFFTLTPTDGEKFIYFRVIDKAYNSAQILNSIILDLTPPQSLLMIINNGDQETYSTNLSLNLNAYDALSGVFCMSFSTDGYIWIPWMPYNTSMFLQLLPEDGEKIIYFKVNDRANNIAGPISETIFLNTSIQKINDTEKEDEELPRKITFWNEYWLFIFIIILIIIVTMILVSIIKLKKRSIKNPQSPEKDTINPTSESLETTHKESLVEPILSGPTYILKRDDEQPPQLRPTHLSEISNKAPTLQTRVPQQTLKANPQLQLPPAQPQISKPKQVSQQFEPDQPQQAQQKLCSTCGQALTCYTQNNKYYCHQCKKYE